MFTFRRRLSAQNVSLPKIIFLILDIIEPLISDSFYYFFGHFKKFQLTA